MTEARVLKNLLRVALDSGEAGIRTRDLLFASPAPDRYATQAPSPLQTNHDVESQDNVSPWGTIATAFISRFWACVVLIIKSRLFK